MAGLALAAILAGACASSATTPSNSAAPPSRQSSSASNSAGHGSPSAGVRPSGSASASGSAATSGSAPAPGASGSAAASPASACVPGINLVHVDPGLEAGLPCTIGNVDLERFSFKLSDYIASSTGGERDLYAPWLVQFGLTSSDVNIAVVADLTQRENFVIHAIEVPGAADDMLASTFGDQARKAGWPVVSTKVGSEPILKITDPAAAGSLSVAYVFARNHVLYAVITDDPSLMIEALAKLTS
jgi:hypothetical protein